jgi:hypothetical protein
MSTDYAISTILQKWMSDIDGKLKVAKTKEQRHKKMTTNYKGEKVKLSSVCDVTFTYNQVNYPSSNTATGMRDMMSNDTRSLCFTNLKPPMQDAIRDRIAKILNPHHPNPKAVNPLFLANFMDGVQSLQEYLEAEGLSRDVRHRDVSRQQIPILYEVMVPLFLKHGVAANDRRTQETIVNQTLGWTLRDTILEHNPRISSELLTAYLDKRQIDMGQEVSPEVMAAVSKSFPDIDLQYTTSLEKCILKFFLHVKSTLLDKDVEMQKDLKKITVPRGITLTLPEPYRYFVNTERAKWSSRAGKLLLESGKTLVGKRGDRSAQFRGYKLLCNFQPKEFWNPIRDKNIKEDKKKQKLHASSAFSAFLQSYVELRNYLEEPEPAVIPRSQLNAPAPDAGRGRGRGGRGGGGGRGRRRQLSPGNDVASDSDSDSDLGPEVAAEENELFRRRNVSLQRSQSRQRRAPAAAAAAAAAEEEEEEEVQPSSARQLRRRSSAAFGHPSPSRSPSPAAVASRRKSSSPIRRSPNQIRRSQSVGHRGQSSRSSSQPRHPPSAPPRPPSPPPPSSPSHSPQFNVRRRTSSASPSLVAAVPLPSRRSSRSRSASRPPSRSRSPSHEEDDDDDDENLQDKDAEDRPRSRDYEIMMRLKLVGFMETGVGTTMNTGEWGHFRGQTTERIPNPFRVRQDEFYLKYFNTFLTREYHENLTLTDGELSIWLNHSISKFYDPRYYDAYQTQSHHRPQRLSARQAAAIREEDDVDAPSLVSRRASKSKSRSKSRGRANPGAENAESHLAPRPIIPVMFSGLREYYNQHEDAYYHLASAATPQEKLRIFRSDLTKIRNQGSRQHEQQSMYEVRILNKMHDRVEAYLEAEGQTWSDFSMEAYVTYIRTHRLYDQNVLSVLLSSSSSSSSRSAGPRRNSHGPQESSPSSKLRRQTQALRDQSDEQEIEETIREVNDQQDNTTAARHRGSRRRHRRSGSGSDSSSW